MNKIKEFKPKHWKLIMSTIIASIGTLLIIIISIFSNSDYLLGIGMFSFVIWLLLCYFLFSSSRIFCKITSLLGGRIKVINLFLLILFGSILSTSLTIQANQIMQEQNDIANRDTAPSPVISSKAVDGGFLYAITNEKGLISYSSLCISEEYYFMVNNRGHEINFYFDGEPTGNTTTLNNDNKTISFFVPNYDYDADQIYSELHESITTQTNADPILSNSRKISFHFFDYQNEPRTFTHSEYQGEIRLQNTDSLLSSPGRNISYSVFDENQIREQIPEAVNQVLTMDPDGNGIDY